MDTTPTGDEFETRLAELKEVKLKLPLRHHVSLHSLKLLRNRSISELVATALDTYFAKNALPTQATGDAPLAHLEADVVASDADPVA